MRPVRNRIYIARCPSCDTVKMICTSVVGQEGSTAQSVGEAITRGLHVTSLAPEEYTPRAKEFFPDVCKPGCGHTRPLPTCSYCGGFIFADPVERVGELGASNFYMETLHPDCAQTRHVEDVDYDSDHHHPINWGNWERPDSPEAAADAAPQKRQEQIDSGQLEMPLK